jgi:CheY-like chemotaxis protein
MENAKILIVDDRPDIPKRVGMVLMGSGHEISSVAATRHEAYQRLKEIKDGILDCNVVLLDGNLHSDSTNAEDAEAISQHIEEEGVPVRVIGFSASPMPSSVVLDIDVSKPNLAQLEDEIDALDDPEVA